MDMMQKIEGYTNEFLKEEEKCLKSMKDPWIIVKTNEESESEYELSNPDICIIDHGNELDDTFRGLLIDEGVYVLFYNSGDIYKWCKISQDRAIKYMIMCDLDLISEWGLEKETIELIEKNEVLHEMYTANREYSI